MTQIFAQTTSQDLYAVVMNWVVRQIHYTTSPVKKKIRFESFDPWKRYELHPDHPAARRVTLDARIAAKMPLFHPELREQGLAAWTIGEMWLFNAAHWNSIAARRPYEMSPRAHSSTNGEREWQSDWSRMRRSVSENRDRGSFGNGGRNVIVGAG